MRRSPLVALLLASALLGAACSAATSAAPPAAPDAGAPDPAADASAPPAPDPTGWARAGKLHHARALATASLLPDGRALVTGGEADDYTMLASTEIFDPATNAFVEVAPLPAPRDHHTATVLKSGKVLVAGGGQGSEISLPTGEQTLDSALLYDPTSNTWQATGSMHAPRAGHRAVLLEDGRVLVAGGGSKVGYPCNSIHPNCNVADSIGSAEIYDPATGEWTATGALLHPRLAFALTATPSGVIASGGAAANHGLVSVEIFDAVAGTWREGPALAGERLYHSAVVLGGKLVVAGGKIANVSPITSVDVLYEAARAWKKGASLDQPRTGASFVRLPSGRGLLVAGSNQVGETFLAEAAVYDPEVDTWTKLAPLAEGRYSQASVALNDGTVVVIGGRTADGVSASVERSR
ncbi:MAG TPA: kelch repeat-containing protein [Labilithrix sp.]|nr:kelch repeat-containing protein [Labilithrix sp.]